MFLNILYGCTLIIVTSVIHSITTWIVLKHIAHNHPHESIVHRILRIDLVVLLTIVATLVESALWALSYWGYGVFEKFETALYFSMVTFATLGYGDIVLDEQYRLWSGIEAANGVLMFGWSTAIIVMAIPKISNLK